MPSRKKPLYKLSAAKPQLDLLLNEHPGITSARALVRHGLLNPNSLGGGPLDTSLFLTEKNANRLILPDGFVFERVLSLYDLSAAKPQLDLLLNEHELGTDSIKVSTVPASNPFSAVTKELQNLEEQVLKKATPTIHNEVNVLSLHDIYDILHFYPLCKFTHNNHQSHYRTPRP